MVDDIIEIVKDRFEDFDLYMFLVYIDHNSYRVYQDNKRIGCITFYSDCINIEIYTVAIVIYDTIYYADIDVDILAGYFLCEAFYNGR